ncbi:predicted protein [Naegleria gruberi]|uniref:Predicted protein n=1 Tax=Naegleria gruberi TaxID=5762 RepID=D2VZ44_NAEGR|nr:uncharacterized protein NAEGRDRAFT_74353 [Naegleria gruberi]EFC37927.1 predicted protein [Naegleria gruberi]|eukprot:XP_002670671.1 predicted protein [Naegleria gruberi strain NEG-M]
MISINSTTPSNSAENSPMGIIGMSCMFPGQAVDVESFWQVLLDGSDTSSTIPKERQSSRFHNNKQTYNRAHFLEKPLDEFDFEFFEISKKEACSMDPQHRLLLQQVYIALEDAGIKWEEIRGRNIGVFCSVMNQDYLTMKGWHDMQTYNSYSLINSSPANNSARISYHFDLRGPSFTLDTMCSGSLVALNCACESLQRDECEMAIVAGVNLNYIPQEFVSQKLIGAAAPDGRCKTFSSHVDGYGKSEGVAHANSSQHERVHALIMSTWVNHDGERKSGITMPSLEGQVELLEQVYNKSGIPPQHVYYVESHGTGTTIGDKIETQALDSFFGRERRKHKLDKLPIGSVKSNIGHTEATSGIASIIKAILMMKHRKIAKSIHCTESTLNPHIEFEKKQIRVVMQEEEIPSNINPVIIGINSFGMGGTNAHCILQSVEQLEHQRKNSISEGIRILPLSAKSEYSLKMMSSSVAEFSAQCNQDDLLFNYCEKKSQFRDYRASIIYNNKDELVEKLLQLSSNFSSNESTSIGNSSKREEKSDICFVFSGQGPQWFAMGRQLLETNNVFSATVERIDSEMQKIMPTNDKWSIVEELTTRTEKDTRIYSTNIAQPCIFAVQCGCYEVLKSYGVTPRIVVGHSVGEVTAAYVHGCLTLEEAVFLIYHRARLQNKCATILKEFSKTGKMMAINLGLDKLASILDILGFNNTVEIASVNSNSSVVVGGEEHVLKQLQLDLTKYVENEPNSRVNCVFLRNEAAFHTSHMEVIKKELLEVLSNRISKKERGTKPNDNIQAVFSTVTGRKSNLQEMSTPEYWWNNVRGKVLFSQAMEEIFHTYKNSIKYVIEISSHPVLNGYIKDISSSSLGNEDSISVIPTLIRKKDEQMSLLQVVSSLFVNGYSKLDWKQINRYGENSKILDGIPKYPFQKQSCWSESYESLRWRIGQFETINHPLLGNRKFNPMENSPDIIYESLIDISSNTDQMYIRDHKIENEVFFPYSGFVEISSAAILDNSSKNVEELRLVNFKVVNPMILQQEPRIVQVHLNLYANEFRIFSKKKVDLLSINYSEISKDPSKLSNKLPCDWTLHAFGSFKTLDSSNSGDSINFTNRELKAFDIFRNFTENLDEKTQNIHKENIYFNLSKCGLNYGPCFQGLDLYSQVGHDETREVLMAQISHPKALENDERYCTWHPALLDSCFQMMICSMPEDTTYLPISTDEITIIPHRKPNNSKHTITRCVKYSKNAQTKEITCDLQVLGESNEPFISFNGFKVSPLETKEKKLQETSIVSSNFAPQPIYSKSILPSMESLQEFILNFKLNEYSNEHESLNRFVTKLCESSTIELSVLNSRIQPEHLKRLAQLTIELALQMNLVQYDSDTYTVVSDLPNRFNIIKSLREFPRIDLYSNLIDLVENSLIHMKQLLTGEADPVSVLFSRKEHVLNDYYDEVSHQTKPLFDFILNSIPKNGKKKTLRILEIGAGLGGTTKQILPILDSLRDYIDVKYVFTDISPLFLVKAKEKFAQFEYFMEFSLLDIEKPFVSSEFIEKDSFDLVIAANVVHATQDLKSVFSLISSLLVSNGQLVLVESDPLGAQFLHFFVGTLKGWWYFKDSFRKQSALLSGNEWEQVLLDCDFPSNVMLPIGTANYIIAKKKEKNVERWLFFSSETQKENLLCEELKSRGVKVVKIIQGEKFQQLDSGFVINPADFEHFESIFNQTLNICGIIFGWPLSLSSFEFETVSNCVESMYSICKILKFNTGRCKFVALTSSVFGYNQECNISQSSIVGCLRSIQTEIFQKKLKVIDMQPKCSENSIGEIVDDVLESVYTHDEIVYSESGRFVHFYSNVIYNSLTSQKKILNNGCWVISGGLGGIGLKMCEWLVEKMKVSNIALLTRRMPNKSEKLIIDKIMLNNPNASIDVYITDICNYSTLYQTMQEIHQKFPITGIVHSAMVLSDCAANKMTKEKYETVARPKILGGFNLHQCSIKLNCNLSTFLMLSSFSSLVGAFGQSNYNSGNYFLESLCSYRRSCGLAGQSLGLSLITGAGYATKAEVDEYFWVGAMHVHDLLDHFEYLIEHEMDLPPAMTFFGFEMPEDSLSPHVTFGRQRKESNIEGKSTTTDSNVDGIVRKVSDIVSKVFGMDESEIQLEKPLVDYGLDSLMSVEIRNILSREFSSSITVSTLLSGVSVSTLVEMISNSGKSSNQQLTQQSNSPNQTNSLEKHLLLETIQERSSENVLLCFPALGGTVHDFRDLNLEEFSIYVINLDYLRNNSDWTAHFMQVWDCVHQLFNSNTVTIYGHSMGALVALEFTRFIQFKFNKKPVKLIVSGNAPGNSLHGDSYVKFKTLGDQSIIYGIVDLDLFPNVTEGIENLDEKAKKIRDLMEIPLFKHQFDFLLKYHCYDDDIFGKYQVDCPVIALRGEFDKLVTGNTINNWNKFAGNGLNIITVKNCGHQLDKHYSNLISHSILGSPQQSSHNPTPFDVDIAQDKNSVLTPLERTLYIPLVSRALESLESDGILYDPIAVKIFQNLPEDLSVDVQNDRITRTNIVGRTIVLDRKSQEFVSKSLAKHEKVMIVNLGCGLCSRYERLFGMNEKVHWIDIDLPNVIELRRQWIYSRRINIFRSCFHKKIIW